MSLPQQSKKRVLVVDDDRTFRHALTTLLGTAGFASIGAVDGGAALDELQAKRFDLVLLDLGLPGIPGLDILAEIQKMQTPPRVIIVTADDTPSTVLQDGDQIFMLVTDDTVGDVLDVAAGTQTEGH